MSSRLAQVVSRYPRLVLGFWLLLAALSLPLSLRVNEVFTVQPALSGVSEAETVRRLLASDFGQKTDFSVVMVVRRSETGTAGVLEQEYARAIGKVEQLPGITGVQDYRNSAGLPLLGDEGRYAIAVIGIDAGSLERAQEVSTAIRQVLDEHESLQYHLAGGPATVQELAEISDRDTRRAELFGLPLSLLVLGIAFGALVASGLPLLVAVTSISLSFAALYLLGQVMQFALFTQSIVTMLGLATGIDYALLLVNRFREELRKGLEPSEAALVTSMTAGKAVTFSGLTVVLALSALLVPPVEFVRSIGIGTVVVVLLSVLVSTTALPSILTLLGHRVNLLKLTSREPGMRSRTFWRDRAALVMRRPRLWALGGSAFLLLLSVPALRMQVADPGPLGLGPDTDARRVYSALEGVGLEGMLRSVDVLVDFGEEGFFRTSSQKDLVAFSRRLKELGQVQYVYSAVSVPSLPPLMLYQYYATPELAHRSELAPLVAATVSENGRYALMRVMPRGYLSPPDASALLAAVRAAASDLELAIRVGGGAMFDAEWTAALYRYFPLAVALVYLATFVLLGLAFRSLLIPLKSIVLNSLTVGAAFGIITLVFQNGFLAGLLGLSGGLGFVDSSAPLFIFAIVFGLSMDYEVFLVARIYEAHRRGATDVKAVTEAVSATGGVITSAAAIMIVVFSIFIFSEVVLIKTLGLGMTVAVLLDATLVRVALVPAAMRLMGRLNWWMPGPLARFADRLGISHD